MPDQPDWLRPTRDPDLPIGNQIGWDRAIDLDLAFTFETGTGAPPSVLGTQDVRWNFSGSVAVSVAANNNRFAIATRLTSSGRSNTNFYIWDLTTGTFLQERSHTNRTYRMSTNGGFGFVDDNTIYFLTVPSIGGRPVYSLNISTGAWARVGGSYQWPTTCLLYTSPSPRDS